jgi:hypothetical protein
MAIRLETSTGRGVDNWQGREISSIHLNWAKELPKEFPHVIRRTQPSPLYNCHGLVFGCRRTRIEKSTALGYILNDDNYIEIPMANVLPGDIVIYYSEQGDPNHSGVVLEYNSSLIVPIIFSKWGNAGEYIHPLRDCPSLYGPIYKFYRCQL